MALLFMDSFDHYVTADVAKKWSSRSADTGNTTAINATGGRHSSASFRCVKVSLNRSMWTKLLVPTGNICVMGVAYKIASATTQPIQMMTIFSSGGGQVTLRVNADLTVSMMRGGTVLGTSGISLAVATFTYVEMKVTISPTVGTVDVRFNGVLVPGLSGLTGLNTANVGGSTWSGIALNEYDDSALGIVGTTLDYDDFYVLDGSGAAPWNTFLGDVRVDARFPTGASANGAPNTGWTPSAGANWQNVDDTPGPNDDTDYNETVTSGVLDTFVVQDIPVTGALVYGVQHNMALKKWMRGCVWSPPLCGIAR